VQKQIKEDFNFAKQIAATNTIVSSPSPSAPQKVQKQASSSSSSIQYDGPCSSKTADLLDSITLPNDNHSSIVGDDDRMIAELLQAEFDLEHDEEIKRVETSRNKSEK
jgi:hypothetical protein